jgi:hypothetical protein
VHVLHGPQATPEALSNAASPANDVPNRGHERAVLSDRPQSEVAKPPTLHKPSSDELLKGALYGVRVGLHATCDLAGMKFLAGRARQQPEDVRSDPAPAD